MKALTLANFALGLPHLYGQKAKLRTENRRDKKRENISLVSLSQIGSLERRYEGEKKEEKGLGLFEDSHIRKLGKKSRNSEVTRREVARKRALSLTERLERKLADKEEDTFRHFPHSKKGVRYNFFPIFRRCKNLFPISSTISRKSERRGERREEMFKKLLQLSVTYSAAASVSEQRRTKKTFLLPYI